jgi:hypothetical protein
MRSSHERTRFRTENGLPGTEIQAARTEITKTILPEETRFRYTRADFRTEARQNRTGIGRSVHSVCVCSVVRLPFSSHPKLTSASDYGLLAGPIFAIPCWPVLAVLDLYRHVERPRVDQGPQAQPVAHVELGTWGGSASLHFSSSV